MSPYSRPVRHSSTYSRHPTTFLHFRAKAERRKKTHCCFLSLSSFFFSSLLFFRTRAVSVIKSILILRGFLHFRFSHFFPPLSHLPFSWCDSSSPSFSFWAVDVSNTRHKSGWESAAHRFSLCFCFATERKKSNKGEKRREEKEGENFIPIHFFLNMRSSIDYIFHPETTLVIFMNMSDPSLPSLLLHKSRGDAISLAFNMSSMGWVQCIQRMNPCTSASRPKESNNNNNKWRRAS